MTKPKLLFISCTQNWLCPKTLKLMLTHLILKCTWIFFSKNLLLFFCHTHNLAQNKNTKTEGIQKD